MSEQNKAMDRKALDRVFPEANVNSRRPRYRRRCGRIGSRYTRPKLQKGSLEPISKENQKKWGNHRKIRFLYSPFQNTGFPTVFLHIGPIALAFLLIHECPCLQVLRGLVRCRVPWWVVQ